MDPCAHPPMQGLGQNVQTECEGHDRRDMLLTSAQEGLVQVGMVSRFGHMGPMYWELQYAGQCSDGVPDPGGGQA